MSDGKVHMLVPADLLAELEALADRWTLPQIGRSRFTPAEVVRVLLAEHQDREAKVQANEQQQGASLARTAAALAERWARGHATPAELHHLAMLWRSGHFHNGICGGWWWLVREAPSLGAVSCAASAFDVSEISEHMGGPSFRQPDISEDERAALASNLDEDHRFAGYFVAAALRLARPTLTLKAIE